MTFADDNYMQTYFGITSTQSTQSGIAVFNAEGGLKDLALKSILSRKIDRHWSLKGVAGYKVLVSDVDRSPLAENLGSEHQLILARTWFINFKIKGTKKESHVRAPL